MAGALKAIQSVDYRALLEVRAAAYDKVREARQRASPYRATHPRARRLPTTRALERATFVRDSYTCRYSHCLRQTIDLEVLKLLSKAFPEMLPYHPNWRPGEDHIVYWIYSTSVEHAISFPNGGTSAAENLLTACYLCNDVKKQLPAEMLGWGVAPVSESKWRGLTEHLPELRRAVAALKLSQPGV